MRVPYLLWMSSIVGLVLVGLGAWRFAVARRRRSRPTMAASAATLAVGMLILAVASATAMNGSSDSTGEVVGSFVAVLAADGSSLSPASLWLYPAEDLKNGSRTPKADQGGLYRLRRGARYIVNAEVPTPGYEHEYAATESTDWRHFDLYFASSGGARYNIQKAGTYVRDGNPKNPDGRFILFSIP
jgi:hypothetical protein